MAKYITSLYTKSGECIAVSNVVEAKSRDKALRTLVSTLWVESPLVAFGLMTGEITYETTEVGESDSQSLSE